MVYTTHTPEETAQIALDLAIKTRNQHTIIAIQGDLGAGKTTFTQGFAKGLGITQKILSPTFIVTRQYPIPNTKFVFYHIDLYRLDNPIDLVLTGLQEIFDDPLSIVIIEWSEKILGQLPEDIITIKMEPISKTERKITIHE